MKTGSIKYRVGDIYPTKHGSAVITNLLENPMVEITFLDTGYTRSIRRSNLSKGVAKDVMYKSVRGVGYLGHGEHTSGERAHLIWTGMISRCYGQVWKASDNNFRYNECSVAEEWHNFQTFAEWYSKQAGKDVNEIDKDLLAAGNKIYSKDTCTLLPHRINTALLDRQSSSMKGFPGVHYLARNRNYVAQMSVVGETTKHIGSYATPQLARDAYLARKKWYLAKLAEEYKDVIEQKAYCALINWKPL